MLNLKSFSLIKRYCPCVLLVYVQVQLSLWYHAGIRDIFVFSNPWVVKRVLFSTFITRSASEVFYLLATVSSHSIFPVLHLENCIRFQDITVSEPLWASERGVVKPHCDDCTGKQWYTRPARSQTEGRRTHKHGPRLKCLCPLDQGTWNRYLKPITLLERGCMRWTAYKSNN